MHELGVTESIISIALENAREAQASKITKVNVVLGELSGFVPESIQFYFDSLSKDSIAEDANLHFEVIPPQFRCQACSTTFTPENAVWTCPKCHGKDIEIQ